MSSLAFEIKVRIPRGPGLHSVKSISIYKAVDQCSEQDDYESYQSSVFGRRKLKDINTMEDVIHLIQKCDRILVLTGAGISVSSGIPDFRSENGLYAQIKEQFPSLTEPEAMFDMKQFIEDPDVFYSFAHCICPGFDEQSIAFYPTPTHYFIKLLEEKGKLLMNYTQNIDTLEPLAGIQKVVQCHGSFATASCINCEFQIEGQYIKDHLKQKRTALCPYCRPSESDLLHLKALRTSKDCNSSNPSNSNSNSKGSRDSTPLRSSQPILEMFDALNGAVRVRIPSVMAKDVNALHDLCPLLFQFDDERLKINVHEPGTDAVRPNDRAQCSTLELVSKCGDFKLLQLCYERLVRGLKQCTSFGVMKPDITFFHQELSSSYHELIAQHVKECDLLIVIGTSLNVMPVSMVPSKLKSTVPAILINREVPRQHVRDEWDVHLLGNCDDVVNTLIHKLQWKGIVPKHRDDKSHGSDANAVKAFLEEKEGVDEEERSDGGIAVEMKAVEATEYEFVDPNYCVFPNGVLPRDSRNDLDDSNDETLSSDDDSCALPGIEDQEENREVIISGNAECEEDSRNGAVDKHENKTKGATDRKRKLSEIEQNGYDNPNDSISHKRQKIEH